MINKGMLTSDSMEWATPWEVFQPLDEEFHFTLDVCATKENRKCEKFFSKEQDGLRQDWTGETVWCNPPYGKDIWKWCRKCLEHSIGGGVPRSC